MKRIAEDQTPLPSENFFVEIGPLGATSHAEEYHQNCIERIQAAAAIPRAEMGLFSRLRITTR